MKLGKQVVLGLGESSEVESTCSLRVESPLKANTAGVKRRRAASADVNAPRVITRASESPLSSTSTPGNRRANAAESFLSSAEN